MAEATGSRGDASTEAGIFTHRQIMIILSGLLLGMFLAALDQTIVSAAMRTIADKLHGQTNQAWATTAYLVTSTVSTPLYGKLSDIYGRKKLYLFAIIVFLIGSVICGTSRNMIELAGCRAIQGLGAGGLLALAFAIMGDMVPPRQRAKYQGYFMAVFGTSSVAGPVLGGLLAGRDTLLGVDGWRWVFYVNVPVGLIALVVVTKFLNLPRAPRAHRIDFQGAALLVSGVTALLLVAEQGRDWGWGSGRSFALYSLGLVLLIGFVWTERRVGDDAILPLKMFRHPVFSVASLLNFIIGMGMFGGIVCLPLYMQIVKGFSPTKAGLSLLPLMLGLMSVSLSGGLYTARTGRYKRFPIVGTAVLIVALFSLSHIHYDTSYLVIAPLVLLMGAGLGGCMQTLVLATQNAVAPSEMGVATAAAMFFRSMGGTFGTAVFLTVFFSGATSKIGTQVQQAADTTAFQSALRDPANAGAASFMESLSGGGSDVAAKLNDTSFLNGLPEVFREPFLIGFAQSMDRVFLLAALVVVPAFVLSFFLKEMKLRSESGLQAQASERAEAEAREEAAIEGLAF
ncbi:MAG: drug resistance transporter, EmrB/QacA subfamily [Frankiales bacterium]|nr:drug resistance transporter, EmrB/QacA subfamily [Frankiales bacterium]